MVDVLGKRSVQLEGSDVYQIHAILMTHAEIQDTHITSSLELISRLQLDDPVDGADMIADLKDQVDNLETDSDNLKRIATLFL